MEKIVSLTEHIENVQQRRMLKEYRSRIGAIKKVTHCSSCHIKCSMCGQYLEMNDSGDIGNTEHEYIFCNGCRDEFEDFLSLSKGIKRNQALWHNEEWKRLWAGWLQYQKALKDFTRSSEFRLLMEEMDE